MTSTPIAIKAVPFLVKQRVLVFDVGDHIWRLCAGVEGIDSYLWLWWSMVTFARSFQRNL